MNLIKKQINLNSLFSYMEYRKINNSFLYVAIEKKVAFNNGVKK
jgi:hypothetical protein